ncbi:cofilin-2-like [Cheilinus undulatus]|uniref:cofilin-2-like n=1 Tax=Cheilinus undulatus TaxID=241271 RepID=UPI001BD30468|nr:cofilin-2-like [Cheilinus undulatus]
MASGVTVADEVVQLYNNMKVRKQGKDQVKKAVLFRINDDQTQIIVDDGKHILVEDIGGKVEDPYTSFVKLFPPEECRYALYDAWYETKECKKEDLVFISWAPDGASCKNKMIYASSKDALKKKCTGIKHHWQVTDMAELQDRSELADKLGGNVVSLEGKRL